MRKLFNSIVAILVINGCGAPSVQTPQDSPTEGTITVAVDESFKPLMDAQFKTYAMLYPGTTINVKYVPEGDAYRLLAQDCVRFAVGTRELNANELDAFKKATITPTKIKIASDAIALICNKNNKDTALTALQLQNLITGKANNWKTLNSATNSNDVVVVLDNAQSSTASFLKQKFLNGAPFPKNVYALKNNLEVIAYVREHSNSIGVIGTSWISDCDDPTSDSLRKSITVMALQSKDSKEPTAFYQPYQAYLSMDKYLLTRPLYIIKRESRMGLGSGFTAFVSGEKGQRIILKSGLLPAVVPVRIVGFAND
jgi:phosphate transport system substrate-binding protein